MSYFSHFTSGSLVDRLKRQWFILVLGALHKTTTCNQLAQTMIRLIVHGSMNYIMVYDSSIRVYVLDRRARVL